MLSWLEGAFQTVLNMSIAAAVIIAAVLLARLLLRRAPKSFSYALWAVVLFRLLCPVSVSSAVSLLGLLDAPAQENTQYTTMIEYYAPPAAPQLSAPPVSVSAPPAVSEPVTGGGTAGGQAGAAGVGTGETAAIVWALGVCAMLTYGTASYIRLRRRLVGNIALEGNIRLADGINSPFVLGIFRPKIYLPSDICEGEREYIVLHERQHIRRGDHVFKALAFIALSLHWFNPLAWLAFVLAGRDMEMSCDEAVLKKLGEGVRADYSASLLRFASGRRGALSVPLAFGESGITGRIKNLLRWKRPRAWMSATAALLCAIVLAACAVNPAAGDSPARGEYGTAEDIGYCLELAASADGVEFGDMDAEILQQIIDAHYSMTDGQAILARESTDGQSAYVFWLNTGAEDDFTGYENAALSAGVTLLEPGGSVETDPESTISLARLNMTNGTVLLFGQDRPGVLGRFALYNIFWEYLNGEDRPDYFEDAVSRGISFDVSAVDNALAVNYIHPEFGGVSEMIPLTQEQAEEISASDRVSLALDETQFLAVLAAEGETADIYMADTGIPAAALEIIRAHCPVDPTAAPGQTESPLAVARGEYGTAGDLAYYIEYSAGGEFHDMDAARCDEILAEYGDLLNGYSFIARENADGEGYIVGQYNGDPSSSPLNDMSSMEIDGITFVLYPTEEQEAFMDARQAGEVPENVIVPQRSTLEWAINAYTVIIRPREDAIYIDTYNYTSDGINYLEDTRARGVSTMRNLPEPYLEVYYINETYGETYEYIQLTDAEAEAMLAEERESVEGFGAMLFYDGESAVFSDGYGAPRSAIDLAVERCGYEFVSPADITGDIVEARLDWLGEPIYADEADLPRLRSLLVNAEKGYMGKCGYGAKLTLTLSSGQQVTAYKGTDSCDSICFGSCNGYFLGGDAANDEFWSIFGMGRMPDSNEVMLDGGGTAYAALYAPASVHIEWASGGYTSGFLAGLDESYNLAYDGGYTGTFGTSGMFLALRGMPAAGSAPLSLFVSTDGGASWHTMGDPYRQGLYTGVMTGVGFYDADTAFLCYRYYEDAGPTVYCTYDGGGSWSRLEVEIPAQYVSDLSRWVFTPHSPGFDGANGVIPVEVLDQDTGETTPLNLITHDAGRTWDWE